MSKPTGNPAPTDEEPQEYFFVHHATPLPHGGLPVVEIPPMVLPPFDRTAARQPVRPGLPPLFHVALPAPEAWQLVPPQADMGEARSVAGGKPVISDQRVTFPVAESPGFHRLSPASPVDVSVTDLPGESDLPARPAAVPAPEEQATPRPISVTGPIPPGERIDPLYAFLLFLALSFGTLYLGILDVMGRYTVLWTVLIILGVILTLLDADEPPQIASASLGWGFSFGFVFSLPLLILVSSGLADLAGILFPGVSRAMLFQSLVLIGPLGETLFFRGVLLERRGFAVSVLGAGLSAVLFYWPAASPAPVYLVAVVLFTTVLAGIYGFVRLRYGLTAACVCQMTVNLMLLFAPAMLG